MHIDRQHVLAIGTLETMEMAIRHHHEQEKYVQAYSGNRTGFSLGSDHDNYELQVIKYRFPSSDMEAVLWHPSEIEQLKDSIVSIITGRLPYCEWQPAGAIS